MTSPAEQQLAYALLAWGLEKKRAGELDASSALLTPDFSVTIALGPPLKKELLGVSADRIVSDDLEGFEPAKPPTS